MRVKNSITFAERYKYQYAFFLGLALFFISYFSMTSAVTQNTWHLSIALWGTITVMFLDTLAMYPKILTKVGYLSHHFISSLGCFITYLFVDDLILSGVGLIGYTAMGAAFRRMHSCSRQFFPQQKILQQSLYYLQIFFDFCDVLVIYFFWDIISKLPISIQVIYYLLVAVRYYINFNDVFKRMGRKKLIETI